MPAGNEGALKVAFLALVCQLDSRLVRVCCVNGELSIGESPFPEIMGQVTLGPAF